MNKKRMSKLLSGMLCIMLVFAFCISSAFATVSSKTITSTSWEELASGVSLSITCTYTTDGVHVFDVISLTSALTGNTSNYSWQESGSPSITRLDGNRTFGITVYGTLTQHLYVNGEEKTYSTSESGYTEFYK